MLQKRDALHTKKVSDSTSDSVSGDGQLFAQGLMGEKEFLGRISYNLNESTVAMQVPSSNELDLSDENREKYMGLTKQQSVESVLNGIMVQAGNPDNSKIAQLIGSEGSTRYRRTFEISIIP